MAVLAGAGAGTCLAQQAAAPARGPALFLEGGGSARDATVVGVGLRWPWRWEAERWGGQWSLAADASVHHWSTSLATGREATTQLALVPVLRWRPDKGRSAWFVEGGIGLSLHDSHYVREDARMSTRWNFQDVLAVGRAVGERQEWSLRLVHVSNGGLRKPNPGEDLLLLRWSLRL